MQAQNGLLENPLKNKSPSPLESSPRKPNSAFAAGFCNAMYGLHEDKDNSGVTLSSSLQWLDGWVEGSCCKDRLLQDKRQVVSDRGANSQNNIDVKVTLSMASNG